MWSYPAHALQHVKPNSSQRSSRRIVMSGEQEDDLVDKACVISWKVATLIAVAEILSGLSRGRQRGGEVFYKKARKDSAGKKVLYSS